MGGKRAGVQGRGTEAGGARRRGAGRGSPRRGGGGSWSLSRGRGGPGRGRRAGEQAGGDRPGSAPGEREGRSERSAGSRSPTSPRRPRATVPPKLQHGRRARPGGRGAGSGWGTRRRSRARAGPAGRGGMGTRQTKGSLAERASPGAAPGPRRERPDFWASLLLRAGDKAGRAGAGAGLPPYHRRVGMVQELLRMVRQGRREEAGTLLQHLRQVSAGRGAGGAPAPGAPRPLPSWPGAPRAPPRAPSCGDAAGLEQVPRRSR